MGLVYSTDGSLRVTVVDGSTRTGLYAADGSIYVVQAPYVKTNTTPRGIFHPCGAYWVTVNFGQYPYQIYAPDGTLNVYVVGRYGYGQKITVVSGTLLDYPSSLYAASEVGGWWDSSDLSTLFISTDDTTPVTTVNDLVGQWKDKTSNAMHLSEGTNKPSYQGTNGVRFDGSNDILWRSSIPGLYAAGKASVFWAAKITGTASAIAFSEASSTDNDPIYSFMRAAGGAAPDLTTFIRRDDGTAITATTLLTGVFDGTNRVLGSIDNTTSWIGYNNGTAGSSVSVTRSGTLAGMNRLSLGGLMRASASSWMAMDMKELVAIGRALTTTERTNLVQYLRNKWGI